MKIGIIGTGTWGMALGRMLSINKHDVTMYSVFESEVKELDSLRIHKNLKGMIIPKEIVFTNDIKEAVIDFFKNRIIKVWNVLLSI